MLTALLDILSPVVADMRALEDALIEARLAYTDSCGNTVLCQGTQELLAGNPNILMKHILKYIDIPDYSPLKKITTMTEDQIPQNANTVIVVKGDYVQNKHVDYQIGDIASGGVGVQITGSKSEKSTEQSADTQKPAAAPRKVTGLHWPLYTPLADDEYKQNFEGRLALLCASDKRSLSADVKAFLKTQVTKGLISRPYYKNQEWEILSKHFGYPFRQKAYYNA